MSILDQIFGKDVKQVNYSLGGSGLKQGRRFDRMQDEIIARTLPDLPLMEQTTAPGLGSIVEPLENKDSYDQVSKLNESEMQKLNSMEVAYENLIKQLVTLNSQAASSQTYNKKNAANIGMLKKQIADLNKKIMTSINKLITQTKKTNSVNNRAMTDESTHSNNLRMQLNNMLAKKSNLDSLLTKRQTLTGQLSDRRNELNSTYLHYLVWFISSVTLGALAFNKLSKN